MVFIIAKAIGDLPVPASTDLHHEIAEEERTYLGATEVTAAISERTPLLSSVNEVQPADLKSFVDRKVKEWVLVVLQPFLAYHQRYTESLDGAQDGCNLKVGLIEFAFLANSATLLFLNGFQEHSIVLAPIVALGRLSSVSLASTSIATTLANLTGYSVLSGFMHALDSALTRDSTPLAARLWCLRAGIITCVTIVPTLTVWLHAEHILLALHQEADVAASAALFLRITAMALPAYGLNEIMKRYLSSQDLAYLQTPVLTLVAPLNVLLNYLLVDGPKAYRMGFVGAPLSTAISHNFVAVMTLAVLVFKAPPHDRSVRGSGQGGRTGVQSMLMLVAGGVSGMARAASELWAKDLSTFAVSMLGSSSLAGQAVLLAIVSTAYQVPRAVCAASRTRIRRLREEGKINSAKAAALACLAATLLTALILSNFLLILTQPLVQIFTHDLCVVHVVVSAMPAVVCYEAMHTISAWIDTMLHVTGRPLYFPALVASGDYIIGLPLGLWLAFRQNWGVSGLWAGLATSLAFACTAGSLVLVQSLLTDPEIAQGSEQGESRK